MAVYHPLNSDYPHAPWWTYSEECNVQNGYHATGGIVGYILRCGDKGSSLYQKALTIADGMINKLCRTKALEVHEVGAYYTFLKDILSSNLSERFDVTTLGERLRAMVNDSIERNPEKWPRYSMRPSQYIESPKSLFYQGNKEIIDKEMDYILASRHNDGVWDISWEWGGYPKEFAIAERCGMGIGRSETC